MRFSAAVTLQPPPAPSVKKREEKKEAKKESGLDIILALFVKMPLFLVMSIILGFIIVFGLTYVVGSIAISIFGDFVGFIVGAIFFPVSVALFFFAQIGIGEFLMRDNNN